MQTTSLPHDPFNLIITGVGGQGNVMASRVLGNMLTRKDLQVTIGETFGASQRGGAVMSHLRISAGHHWSPQIPRGRAHLVAALEPVEALRVLKDYGSPETRVLCNMRPIHPIGVICGDLPYPDDAQLRRHIQELSHNAWFVDATDAAMKLGNPIFGNIMIIGALAAVSGLPLHREDFQAVIAATLPAEKVPVNLQAFDMGTAMVAT